MPIRLNLLLCVYIAVPLSALVIVLDKVWLDSSVQTTLPANPEHAFWYVLLFGLPHIVASELTFFRTQYMKRYKHILILFMGIALSAALVVNHLLATHIAYAVFAIWTMIHVIGQQVGISRMNVDCSNWAFAGWKWNLIASACFMMLMMGSTDTIALAPLAFKIAALFTFVSSNFFVFFVLNNARNRFGFWYCLATHLMVITAVLSFALHYSFIAIMLPRVIHDVTAFVFYTSHEYNYHTKFTKDGFGKNIGLNTKAIFLYVPLLAIIIALFLSSFPIPDLILTLIFMHYLLETKIWKHGTPHREHIKFI